MRCVVTIGVAGLLLAPQAGAAPEAMCLAYAEKALRQFDEAVSLNVPNVGPPTWSKDYAGHLAWCRIADPASVQTEEQKREQILAAHRSRTGTIVGPYQVIDDACTRYAKEAVEHQRLNVDKGCGFTGPRWDANQAVHEGWCRALPSPDLAAAESKERIARLSACQSSGAPTLQMQQGTLQATAMGNLLRVPGLVIGLRHVQCKKRTIVYGGTPPLGNHQSGGNQQPDPTVFPHPLLTYLCGGDEGAPDNVGFAWNSFPDGAGPPPETLGLPAGVVFYLWHDRTQEKPVRFYDVDSRRASVFRGGDYGSGSPLRFDQEWHGFHWHETTGAGFDGDWSLVDRLPRYTVIGLKHNVNQQAKRLFWLSPDRKSMITYDPACETCPAPPGFRRVHGGDRGSPAGKGYDWYEKTGGAEPAAIR